MVLVLSLGIHSMSAYDDAEYTTHFVSGLGDTFVSFSSSSTDYKSIPCEHCGRTGHPSDRCWKKFPELKNSNVPKRPKVHLASSSSDIPNKGKVIKDAHDLVKSAQSHKSAKK